MKDEHITIGGELLDETYSDYQPELDLINRAFIEVYSEGDMRERPFTFPIPTYNLTPNFDWNSKNAELLFEMAAKYGLPYFANFVTSGMKASDIRSMCCHLRLDLRELKRNITGGLFGSADQTGSVGVVTMNMPRLGYLSKDEDEFLERLKGLMDLAKESLEVKREVVAKNIEEGLMPFTKRYLGTLENHFSTIGLVGMNEACLNLLGEDISTPGGKDFAIRVLKFMLKELRGYQRETGNLYNLEATPAEGASYRLARLDKERHPDISTAGEKTPYYTNSTLLPVNKTTDVIYAIEHQEALQTLYTGGCVAENTLVFTDRGRIPIKKIVDKEGDVRVLSLNPKTMKTEFRKVLDAQYVDVKDDEKYNITLEGNTRITTSAWHPFFIIDEKLNIRGKRADALVPGDFVLSVSNGFQGNINFDPNFTWALGLLITDGWIGEMKGHKYVTWHSENPAFTDKVIKVLELRYGKRYSSINGEVRVQDKTIRDEITTITGLTYGPKTGKEKLPRDFLSWSFDSRFALLCGVIDGDGMVDESGKYIKITTSSRQLIDDLTGLIYSLGMACYHRPEGKLLHIFVRRHSYSRYLNFLRKYLVSTKKRDRLCNSTWPGRKGLRCDMSVKKTSGVYAFSSGPYRAKGKISFEKAKKIAPFLDNVDGFFVKKVKKVKTKNVPFCDLTVEGNQNYLAGNNGMVFIHNTVFHTFLGERMSSGDACKRFVRKVVENTRMPYITITPTYSICRDHGYISGEHFKCPKCGEDAEVYSRVVGYYRPIANWHVGKQEEYRQRKMYDVSKALS